LARTGSRTIFVCQACGAGSQKWLGRCPSCGEWDTLAEESPQPSLPDRFSASATALSYSEVEKQVFERIVTGNSEVDRVLGGGIVPGSVTLLGGEPGIGKSTLLLQIAEILSSMGCRTLYVAGEESAQQIKLRGDRLGLRGNGLFILGETSVGRILEESERLSPGALVVDSIQTVYSERFDSAPGSIGQIRECAMEFLSFAKKNHVPVFLIGHITKEGTLAGPKALEHIVDVVLYFEGERHQNHKLIRTVKNRFGPANELGVFEMTSGGLRCVENASQLFLAERSEKSPGSSVICAMEGSRPVLVEIQALVSQTNFSTARRMANGVDPNRVALLLAMLEKRVGLHLLGSDVYVNVAGGLDLAEPAIDLALVAAVVSSFLDRPLPPESVTFGEVGLAGEVRAVSHPHVRVREAANMGFTTVFLPRGNVPLPEAVKGVRLEPVESVTQFLDVLGF